MSYLDDLYTINRLSEIEVEVFLSDENHPIFKAHFPNNPILPGFIHLEIISDIFNVNIIGVQKAKFNELVLPSQNLFYFKSANKITVKRDEKIIASFSLKLFL